MTIRDAIADQLRARIVTGQLQPGDALPSIQTLRTAWECSDGPVRLAFALLAHEGLITTRRGAAARVNNPTDNPRTHRREPTAAPAGRGAAFAAGGRQDRVQLAIPLGDTGVYVELGLSRRLTVEEHEQLVGLISALAPIVVEAP